MKEKDMRKESMRRTMVKKVSATMGMTAWMAMSWGNVVFAGNSYVQNLYDGFLKENLLWIAIGVTVFAVIGCAVKKNHIGIVISLITGAIATYLVMTPEKIKDIGTLIGGAMGL